jgi:O-antigen ligase
VAGVLVAAAIAGALLAYDARLGLAAVIGVIYLPIAFLDVPLALVLWLPVVFMAAFPGVNSAIHGGSLLIAFAWLGSSAKRRVASRALLERHRGLLVCVLMFSAWLPLSLTWADRPGLAKTILLAWAAALALFVIVATTINTPRHVRLLLGAFVVGAVVSVAVGLLSSGLHGAAAGSPDTLTQQQGRLQGGAGDPNFLAASLVPAIVLAMGLLSTMPRAATRWALRLAIVILVLGLVDSESRGGLVAAAVAAVAAVALHRRARPRILMGICLLVAIAGVWFASSPAAWQRIVNTNNAGNGRSSLWTVGFRVYDDHPVIGVGLSNFEVHSPLYVDRPGELKYVDLIAERPHVVHNTYLQLLVETGFIGFALFMTIVVACLRAAWSAARRFEARGHAAMSSIAISVVIAVLGALVASVFLSNGQSSQLWLLLALGPVLLRLSYSMPPRRS